MIVDYFKLYKNNDWQKFAFWDDFRYTRNLIEEIGTVQWVTDWDNDIEQRFGEQVKRWLLLPYPHVLARRKR